jgi:malate dehydrogenase (oxaloacetate-decarboxylating)(NADP+)
MGKRNFGEASLTYHNEPVPGKIALKLTKKCESQEDLSLAYTPGVATPCTTIHENPEDVWKYTARGNLVAVVSDGTAVLGLGNIGPEAAMPVMEGKGVLFKRFADVDVFPICLKDVFMEDGKSDPKKIIETVKRLEPSFGGINLEDIAAPACFEIEQTLKKALSIPVFHDDQHGTAIISLAGVINALKIVRKKIEDCKFVVNGAGAAGIACAEYYIKAGAKRENFVLCDSKGVLDKTRENLNPEKQRFADAACTTAKTLKEAMVDADIFVGVSVAGCVDKDMIRSMARDSIIFPMANPVPEIFPDEALEAGAAVVGTGRSDFANQVNNVLGFPGIFRGALDTRATDINVEMYLGASKALSDIASEKLPEDVHKILSESYPEDAANGMFDGDKPLNNSYVIPKPFDPRVVPKVARNVAEAAMKTGVAQIQIEDLDAYEKQVTERIKSLLKTL